jgi:hypothetical protein
MPPASKATKRGAVKMKTRFTEEYGVDVYGQPVPLVRFMGLPPTTATSGDLEQMSLLAGESSGLIADIPSAGAIVERIAAEARAVIGERLAGLLA